MPQKSRHRKPKSKFAHLQKEDERKRLYYDPHAHKNGMVFGGSGLIGNLVDSETEDWIIQAGSVVDANATGGVGISFPRSFRTGVLSVVAVSGDGTGPRVKWVSATSVDGFTVTFDITGTVRVNWIAIGY